MERSARVRSAPPLAVEQNGVVDALPLRNSVPKTAAAANAIPALPTVHIGTIEVRSQPVPVSVPPTVQGGPRAPASRAAPAASPSPLSRGLAWRYGLVQG
jgi:hypothetical protein